MKTTVKPLVWTLTESRLLSRWDADTPFGPIAVGGQISRDKTSCSIFKMVPPSEEHEHSHGIDLVDDLQPNGDPVTFESRLMEARNEAEEEFAAKIRECLVPVSPAEEK